MDHDADPGAECDGGGVPNIPSDAAQVTVVCDVKEGAGGRFLLKSLGLIVWSFDLTACLSLCVSYTEASFPCAVFEISVQNDHPTESIDQVRSSGG